MSSIKSPLEGGGGDHSVRAAGLWFARSRGGGGGVSHRISAPGGLSLHGTT